MFIIASMNSPQTTETKNIIFPWVDVVRIIAAFLVVLAHAADLVYLPWFWGAFYYSLSRVAVPIFFLTSGYLLLSRHEDLWSFFRKRVSKIALPFLVWSVIYEVVRNQPFAETGVTFQSVVRMFIRIAESPRDDHLWFFYALIGLYLITPILRVFVSKAKDSELLYFIALWFLAQPILLLVEGYTPIRNGFDLFYAGGYVGYFLLGHYLGRLQNHPRLLWGAWAAFAVGLLATFAVFYLDIPPIDNELILRDYPSLNIVVMSLGAFLLLKAAGERAPARLGNLSTISRPVIFGIYLIHPMLLRWAADERMALGFDPFAVNALIMTPIVALLAFAVCWLLVHLAVKVPILRSIF